MRSIPRLHLLLTPPVIVFDETRPKIDVTVRNQLRFIEAVVEP